MARHTTHLSWRMPALCLAAVACAAATASAADTSFFRALLEKDRASVEDAARVVAVLHSRSRDHATFAQDLAYLRKAGIVPAKWRWSEHKPVTCAELAYMLCKALGVKGGLTMRMFGVSKRYAYRQCVFSELLPVEHQGKYLTGQELVAVAGVAEEYLRKTKPRAK